jgi:hypothetical protein
VSGQMMGLEQTLDETIGDERVELLHGIEHPLQAVLPCRAQVEQVS